MNPYLIIGGLVFLAVACAGSAYEGIQFGDSRRAVADQKQFDEINADITKQKAEAHAVLEQALNNNLDLLAERETLKDQLQKDRNNARDKTDSLTRQLSFERLRFPAAEAPGCGPGGGGAASISTEAAGASAAPAGLIQLPERIESDLSALMAKADRLKDDYAECYGYATQMK